MKLTALAVVAIAVGLSKEGTGLEQQPSEEYGSEESPEELWLDWEDFCKESIGCNVSKLELGPWIADRKDLVNLALNGDGRLVGSIPVEICELEGLEVLKLESFVHGEIPRCIGEMLSLRVLSLSSNYLSGTIPETIGDLSNLKELDLSLNFGLSGEISSSIERLSSLRVLKLEINNLTGQVPEIIGLLTNLETLSLRGNHLKGSLPESLWKLVNLQSLDVGSNHFSGSIPMEFAQMISLQELTVSGNQFTGLLPPQSPPNLTAALLDNNRFTSIDGLQGWRSLNFLSASNLPLNRTQVNWISDLQRLSSLYLNNCSLHGPLPDNIGVLSNLELLELSDNYFSSTIPLSIVQLSNMTDLRVGNNQFTGPIFPVLENMSALISVDISHNKFTGSISKSIEWMNLIRLNVGHTAIDPVIPDSFFSLPSLQELSLENIAITRLPPFFDSAKELSLLLPSKSIVCDRDHLSTNGTKWLNNAIDSDRVRCGARNEYTGEAVRRILFHPKEPSTSPEIQQPSHTPFSLHFNWSYIEDPKSDPILYQAFGSFSSFDCNKVIPKVGKSVKQISGLVFILEWAESTAPNSVWNKLCTLEKGLTINNLKPFTNYRVRVGAALMQSKVVTSSRGLTVYWHHKYLQGVRTATLLTKTAEYLPEDEPQNFGSVHKNLADTFLELSWDPSIFPNADNVKYLVQLFHPSIWFPTEVKIPSLTYKFFSLESNTTYLARVRTENRIGVGPWATTYVRTLQSCRAGTKRVTEPTFQCIPCEKDTFADNGLCRKCPPQLPRTITTGAKSQTECTSDTNSFVLESNSGIRKPISCKADKYQGRVTCDEIGMTVENLKVKSSFWRISERSLEIQSCPKPKMCVPQHNVSEASDTSVRRLFSQSSSAGTSAKSIFHTELGFNFSTAASLCNDHHTGILCLSCEGDYRMVNEVCTLCSVDQKTADQGKFFAWVVLAIVLTVILPCTLIIHAVCAKQSGDRSNLDNPNISLNQASRWSRLCKEWSERTEEWEFLTLTTKITIGFYQIALSFCVITGLIDKMDSSVPSAFVNFDVSRIVGLIEASCYSTPTFYTELLTFTVAPIVCIVCLVLTVLALNFMTSRVEVYKLIALAGKYALFILLVVYPAVSTKIFKTFVPQEFQLDFESESDVYRTLEADLTVWYDSETSRGWRIYAGVMVAIYPVGVFFLFVYATWKFVEWSKIEESNRSELQTGLMGSISVLCGQYNHVYFETLELLRKLLLTAVFAIIFDTDQLIGYAFYIGVAFAFFVSTVHLNPFKDRRGSILSAVSFALLILLGFAGVKSIDNHKMGRNIALFVLVLEGVIVISLVGLAVVRSLQKSENSENKGNQNEENSRYVQQETNFEQTQSNSVNDVSLQI